ncbi:MAG: hypothetical protein FGM27_00815 [Candidatus Omnitrophica bacterium]|nr:hypothetical protein [Candidatus Omnitrophota bacterium]
MAFRNLTAVLLGVILIQGAASGCASSRSAKPMAQDHPGLRSFSEIEKEEGLRIHQQIVSQFYLYTDPQVTDYVDRVGFSLAEDESQARENYDFTVLYDEKIYAAAAPGGHVYITTGFLNFIENEAELAAVLAHEVAILQFKDPRSSSKRKTLDGVTQAVSVVAPALGQIGSLAALGAILVNSAAQSGELTREERIENADLLGTRYMLHAGYDPQGMVDLLYKFLKADRSKLPYFYDYYQTYPITERRFEKMNEDFARLPLASRELVMRRKEFLETVRGIREMHGV